MGNTTSTHEPLERVGNFTRGGLPGDANNVKNSVRSSKRSPRKMDRLRRSFRDSFRRRKDRVPESSKPHQWQADEAAVRAGTCTFSVKYLGCVEVFESRGMQVCEEALKVLRNSRRRPVRAVLHVSGDGLRVVEDDTKGLIVDQTIEKVSFCAPDRNHERGFSYICRDGTTRRWMCHGFLALKESGERLSHAVGCAFAACLERKQRRDKECGVTMTFDHKNNTFTRSGSFRQPGLTERLANERGVDVIATTAANNSQPKPFNPFAIERPHATPSMLERQGSFRGFNQLGNNSPFKRQMSLRVNDLPSNAERQRAFLDSNKTPARPAVSPIPEVSPGDSVSQMCQQLSQGLSLLTHSSSDDFNFNNQSSVNQNTNGWKDLSPTDATISPPLSSRGVSIIPSFNTSLPSNPPLTPPLSNNSRASTNFSPSLSQANITPTSHRTRSSISGPTTSPNPGLTSFSASLTQPLAQKVESQNLPNPDQWLGQIVSSTTPKGPSPAVGRRAPNLSVHARARSLSSADGYVRPADPFDAEWAAPVVQSSGTEDEQPIPATSTNPFLASQSFQVQL